MMDIFEVGTGGGSIATVDASGALKVGPQSAGAEPDRLLWPGGRASHVTDANLVLGRLGADRFLSGEDEADARAAERALEEHVGKPLGIDLTYAADGILRIAIHRDVLRGESGVDRARSGRRRIHPYRLRRGGPLHASAIAREIGMQRVIVPRRARSFLRIRNAVLGPALRLRAHLVLPGSPTFRSTPSKESTNR